MLGAILQHTETQGTAGGISNGTSGKIVPLNNIASGSSGVVATLYPDGSFELVAGVYQITASVPTAYANGCRARIVEVSGSTSAGTIGTVLIDGVSNKSTVDTSFAEIPSYATVTGYLTLSTTTRIAVALYTATATGSRDLGVPCGIGGEIYTQVIITG